MDNFSYISNAHPTYVENLYKTYQTDPGSVDEDFQKFFEGFDFATRNWSEDGPTGQVSLDELKVFRLIQAYRDRGHLVSNTNPLKPRKDRNAGLALENFGLSEADLELEFEAGQETGLGRSKLKVILDHLHKAYCTTIGFEYNYVREIDELAWLRTKIENNPALVEFDLEQKERVLGRLNKAVVFEKFLGTKYIGEKRFSLEGGETTIPALDAIINKAAELGVEECTIGMAHRGRLNVLVNIMGKTYEEVFSEFEGLTLDDPDSGNGDGDVKYHLGYTSLFDTDSGKEVYLKLMPNPSHLEAVDPVVLGYTRGKADTIYKSDYDKILPIILHGDAAVAGQGIVYEVLQMAKLDGFETGGTLHFVINNQIGFTTDFEDARSSDYCTSLASSFNAPIIHVNGDDIESVIYAAEMAAEYRQTFNKDIFIDMVCYRKHGHNEADDPKYTQPHMYSLIAGHKNPRDIYIEKLVSSGSHTAEMAKKLDREFWDDLQKRLDLVKEKKRKKYEPQLPELAWKELRDAHSKDFEHSPDTFVSKETIKRIVEALSIVPEGFSPLRKIDKYLKERRKIMADNKSVDWAAAELLSYATLLMEGHDVRLTGQDVKRGTFSHRHAIITDEKTYEDYNRLAHLQKDQGKFHIHNSHLSEYGVLGFEFGYSMANPNTLTIWEAQFGDFANTAQAIIDQFISSSESKWNRKSGLTLLLPHGYEGMGPEHSSARLERFLQLCAELNMVVANVTDPANFFHLMRRQIHWAFRKPLIVMSPKSLLRHPKCQSPIGDVLKGGFKEVMLTDTSKKKTDVKRLLFCSGKVYYDLLDRKEQEERDDVVIVRMEQLYPLAFGQIENAVKAYKNAELYWVQEEPKNMGSWFFILRKLEMYDFHVVARKSSASPATGRKKQHLSEQKELIDRAFA